VLRAPDVKPFKKKPVPAVPSSSDLASSSQHQYRHPATETGKYKQSQLVCLSVKGSDIFVYSTDRLNKVDVLHVRSTELRAAHQNLPPAICTLRLKETIQNIHQKRTISENMIRT